ncbi:flagellar hook-basal body complex protein FliE [Pseudoxanthomonas broegbernensis]|uniref:Flagellar hook-basal body complex protein FliE n=1 Tax=Pseudoxanthomonas broegbernensis TaxID=83619 RepID=A0A7V8GL68_9GAMM|nr:flagellar hook-basal body complex protein FliE [Pseudoxanthomonas broegbernensis]KAF1685603.1 flagellar hook-basal body complex protein FliE [Pseudoxanthomonas broegbernensis]MBB6065978.1 flagellar hook-basal body complex protein FliE [Pseudoxanthomonas broegbernensis]
MTDSISSVLSQIRAYQSQLGQAAHATGDVARGDAIQGLRGVQAPDQAGAASGPSFSQTLRNAVQGVSEAQEKASALAVAFERGEPGADLARVMIASQHAQVAFRATVEVRNKLVQAYQDVMNMPL